MADAAAFADSGARGDVPGQVGDGDSGVSGGCLLPEDGQSCRRYTGILARAALLRPVITYL